MAPDQRPRVLLIGYGNDLRCDDSAGPLIADRVEALRLPGVLAMRVHQLVPELSTSIAESSLVIFVDARLANTGEPVLVERVEPAAEPRSLGHSSGPGHLLQLTNRLHGHTPSAWLVTLPGLSFEVGETISHQIRDALPIALALIEKLAAEHLHA